MAADNKEAQLTRAFSGRQARGLVNQMMKEAYAEVIPDYPIQHYLTQDIRKEGLG